MKKIVLSILFLFTISIVFSQQIIYSKDNNGKTIAKDQYGNIIATGTTDYSGKFVWKDNFGNVIKKETVDYLGRIVSKDENGNIISTSKKNYLGDYEERDQNGNVIAKYKKNYMGEVEKIDQNGNLIGKYKYGYDGKLQYNQQNNWSSTETNSNRNSGAYSNPQVYIPETKTYQISQETAAAIGGALGKTFTGFSVYVGYNDGYNFGINSWHGNKAYWGFHYGSKSFKDSKYGTNTRTDLGANFGFFISKNKKTVLKTTFGTTDLYHDNYDVYPGPASNQTFEQWEVGYDDWNSIEYLKLFYKIGVQFPLGKKPGTGLAPEIYITNNGFGIGLEYIFSIRNSLYN